MLIMTSIEGSKACEIESIKKVEVPLLTLCLDLILSEECEDTNLAFFCKATDVHRV